MKLTSIELQDFRCFGEASFDLTSPKDGASLPMVLLVGPNGSGKSTLIEAIEGMFTAAVNIYGGGPLTVDDIRVGQEQAKIRAEWRDTVDGIPEPFSLAVGIFKKATKLNNRQFGAGPNFIPEEYDHQAYAGWTKAANDASPRETGLIVAFDVYRLLPWQAITGPNIQQVPKSRNHGSMLPTVRRKGGMEARFRLLKQWIVNIDFYRAKAKADRNEESPTWDTLRTALNTVFRPYTFEGVTEMFDVMFQTPTGLVPIEALSDGFRSVFVIITELLLRLSLTTDDPNKILEREAVCLIDEIDAHLHPKWQERVLPGLRALFPNVQFIATTHSPYVVSTVAPHEIFRFGPEEE